MLCDLNCDMGEGIGNDADLMPFISSANISCGFHAGNSQIIRQTIELALEHGVHMGAHPSFRDKEHFGRREMKLSPDKLYAIVLEQLIKIELLTKEKGATLHHVKPHGALYNLAAKDSLTAKTIAQAVKDFMIVNCNAPGIGSGIYVPTGFTPNGDGLNDLLKVVPYGIKEFKHFTLYNRWGELVFRTTDPAKGWDGRINGKDQDTGVCVWVAEAVDFSDKLISIKGTTTLIR